MKTNKLLIGILIAFIGLILLLYYKTGNKPDTKQTITQSAPNETTQATVGIGKAAPDFTLTTLGKETFRLSDRKGRRVILFGMAGWCGTCIPEGRALTEIKKAYADKGVEIIGVAFTKGDNDDFLKEYKKIGGIDIPVALDTDSVAQKYNLIRLETTYIINRDGKIVYKDEVTTDEKTYREELDKIQ